MPNRLNLLPMPHKVVYARGRYLLPIAARMALADPASTFAAEHFILAAGGMNVRLILVGSDSSTAEIRVVHTDSLFPEKSDEIRDQAYRLTIGPKGIEIASRTPAGTFYAFQTLLQIIRESPRSRSRPSLPCLRIADRPDFARRGIYHDTARGKVPKLETMLQLIDDLAHLKINEFQLYIENNFQFKKHPQMYDDADPFTPEELQQLDVACRARHIDFVPSLTSLGHFEKILSRPKYRPLAEAEPEQLANTDIPPTWAAQAPWSLCVTDPRSKKLLREMYDEFLPNFSSPTFNICCDEAFDLGYGRSRKRADKVGRGRLYLDWINFCNSLARRHGKKIQLWGDIIINHPELVPQLPKDATILEWGYEADHKFDEHCALFAKHAKIDANSKRELYVCPGTSSWLTFSTRSKNAFENIHNAARAGLKHNAKGLLITDWGDRGHQQMLAVSLTPMAYGAAAGWNLTATPRPMTGPAFPGLLHAISTHLFHDTSSKVAAVAYSLGLAYERIKCHRPNASVDWFLFREKWETADFAGRTPTNALKNVIRLTQSLGKAFKTRVTMGHPDAPVILAEFLLTCDEIIHTCRHTLLRQMWLKESKLPRLTAQRKANMSLRKTFTQLWMARNKRSRLQDVLDEFDRIDREYRKFGRA